MAEDWEQTLRGILMRMADGDVSDDDVDYFMENIPQVGDNLQEWLQKLVDEPKEQRNARVLLMLLSMYDMYKTV